MSIRKTRFAPSPTGNFHIGSARTALFNWLFAKSINGKFLLRIEDTDKERSTKTSINKILEGLSWLKLNWDDEIVYQSKKQKRHKDVALELLKKGLAYKCFCSKEELEEMREKARLQKKPFRYDRKWRDKDLHDAPKDVKPVIRIKSKMNGSTLIKDIIQGDINVSNEEIDDFIILRSDETPTYMLSVVIDDYDMKITDIIRGHDHLTNTFRQNVIYEALNWEKPTYAHIPLIHGADEIISIKNAVKWFKIEKVGRSPAKFNQDKLINLNSYYLKKIDNNKIIQYLQNYYEKNYNFKIDNTSIKRLNNGLDGIKERSRDLNQLAEMAIFYCSKFPLNISSKAEKLLKKIDKTIIKELIVEFKKIEESFIKSKIEVIMDKFLKEKGLKLSDIIQYIRALLTGLDVSPRVYDVMEILGYNEVNNRINRVING